MVGFSSDKINILQPIKCLFSTIALVPGALDGMNMVWYIKRGLKNMLHHLFQIYLVRPFPIKQPIWESKGNTGGHGL